MNEIKDIINGQLQQLQMFMHRAMFNHLGKIHTSHRGQGRVLAILKLKPVISQKELTYLLNMSKQSVAELVTKLERNGYITREPSEDDKRVMMIRLTEEGAKAAGNPEENEPDALKVLDCLNDDELSDLSEYLGRIIGQYEERFPDGDFEERRKYMEKFMASYGHGYEHGCEHWQHAGYGSGGHGHGHRQAGMGHSQFKKRGTGNDGNNG